MILVIAKMMIFWKNKCFCGFQPVALKLRWFWSTFERNFERKENHSSPPKFKKSAAKAPFATVMLSLHYDLRLSAAKHNSIPLAPAAARNPDATIPLRSAETELPSTKDLQHTTVEHIALMHYFQRAKCLNTCKTQVHSSNEEENKSPGTLSSSARGFRARFHGKATTPVTVPREPTFLRNGTSVHPGKHNVSCKS